MTFIAYRGGDVSQLASSVDDRGAQAAFAIEGISDELERVLVELAELRAELVGKGVPMGAIKSYPGLTGPLCDGRDPEGNVFQLAQRLPDKN